MHQRHLYFNKTLINNVVLDRQALEFTHDIMTRLFYTQGKNVYQFSGNWEVDIITSYVQHNCNFVIRNNGPIHIIFEKQFDLDAIFPSSAYTVRVFCNSEVLTEHTFEYVSSDMVFWLYKQLARYSELI